jgi:aminoglycoside phosphotransferase (APT) family kinase protein
VQAWADDLTKESRWLPELAPQLPLAVDLAQFVADLRRIDPSGASRSQRNAPLHVRDAEARAAIQSLRDVIDADAVSAAWEVALPAPAWDGRPLWTHGDLLPSNLLVVDGRLSAVIDFANVGTGDPAVDVIAAWTVFGHDERDSFRDALDVDDSVWAAAVAWPCTRRCSSSRTTPKTNPAFVEIAKRTVEEGCRLPRRPRLRARPTRGPSHGNRLGRRRMPSKSITPTHFGVTRKVVIRKSSGN